MDFDWAENVLSDWIRSVKSVSGSSNVRLISPSSQTDAILSSEDQVRRVVATVNGLNKLPEIVTRYNGYFIFDDGLHKVQYALGRLRTDAETRKQLGSLSPQMSADALHPTIWGAASALWSDGHFDQAVQRAATFLNADVQDRVGRHDVSDASLMNEAFSAATPVSGKPRLRWPGADDDLTVKSMRDGLRGYASGCFQAIRNPATHATELSAKQVALEQLAALSLLARWVEQCELLAAE